MTKEIRNPKVEGTGRLALCSDFGLRSSFRFRHSTLSSGINENTKNQAPNTGMKTPNTKLQTPEKLQSSSSKSPTSREELGIGTLGFIWSLVFGFWLAGFGVWSSGQSKARNREYE
jgi:hypothetical protein